MFELQTVCERKRLHQSLPRLPLEPACRYKPGGQGLGLRWTHEADFFFQEKPEKSIVAQMPLMRFRKNK